MLFGIPCETKIGEHRVAITPGAVPKTATAALSNAILPYLLSIAEQDIIEALKSDHGFASGVNTYQGKPTDTGLAAIMGVIPTQFTQAVA